MHAPQPGEVADFSCLSNPGTIRSSESGHLSIDLQTGLVVGQGKEAGNNIRMFQLYGFFWLLCSKDNVTK